MSNKVNHAETIVPPSAIAAQLADGATTIVVDLAKDFSPTPGGRYRAEGEFSGQEFREDILNPLFAAGKSVVIDLDLTVGFTTSFLREVFCGAVYEHGDSIAGRLFARSVHRPHRANRAETFKNEALKQIFR